MTYISTMNYIRVLGIRPRGCDIRLQNVVTGTHKIVGKIKKFHINIAYIEHLCHSFAAIINSFLCHQFIITHAINLSVLHATDIPNPLIGDIVEYERFILLHTQKYLVVPYDHGAKDQLVSTLRY